MPARSRPSLSPRLRTPPSRWIRANIFDFVRLLRESRYALIGFMLVILTSAMYIRLTYTKPASPGAVVPIGFTESLYEAFRLLTFQSGLSFPTDPLGRLLFFLVPVLGLALILDSVFRFSRLLLDKSDRPEAWQVALASTYQQHIIVCGLGRVGLRVATQLLDTGQGVVVIEQSWDAAFVKRALDLRIPVVVGDARDADVLRQAGVMRAHAMIVCIDADLVNIEVALNVRALRSELRVIQRVFNDDLDRNLEGMFGRNTVFSASALAAPTYAAAAVSREVDYVMPVGDAALGVAELKIAPDSFMASYIRKIEESFGVRVLLHTNAAGDPRSPSSMRQLDVGDTVTILGPLAALDQLRLKNVARSKARAVLGIEKLEQPTATYNRVIICGLGKVGYRVVKQVRQMSAQRPITCVYTNSTRPEFVARVGQIEGVTMIEGDARSPDVLLAAGLDEAYSVAALTSDDFINMQIGLAARRERKEIHLVMRMFSEVLADQLETLFNIETVYSTSKLAAPTMAAAAVLGDVTTGFLAGSVLFSTDQVQIQMDSPLAHLTVDQVREVHKVLVISIERAGVRQLIPTHTATLTTGDEVLIVARLDMLARLRGLSPLPPTTPRLDLPMRVR